MSVYSDIEEGRWAADRFRSPASAHPKRIGATMETDFTPINVERPNGEVDAFLGRPKHIQLDPSNPRDAAALGWLASQAARGGLPPVKVWGVFDEDGGMVNE